MKGQKRKREEIELVSSSPLSPFQSEEKLERSEEVKTGDMTAGSEGGKENVVEKGCEKEEKKLPFIFRGEMREGPEGRAGLEGRKKGGIIPWRKGSMIHGKGRRRVEMNMAGKAEEKNASRNYMLSE